MKGYYWTRNLILCGFALFACPISAQESLPFDPPPSGSKAERTIALSTYQPSPPKKHLPEDAPNIMVLMLDDAGWGLSETFGGVIHTPAMSRVANSGISYNRFHNAAMCSPTRAALLTGRNHHRVGNGQIAELANDWPGYSGVIPRTAATLPKVLGYYGYSTSSFGKWHNTPANETTTVGPYTNWPVGTGIGFDYFYGFLAGESSQYETAVVENTVRTDPSEGKEHYHFTEDMTEKAVSWIKQQRALAPDRPFFMYWAPGGVHGPHHVGKDWADKYKGKFDDGWDALRVRLYEGQKKAGWIPENAELTARPDTLPAWSDIPADEKAFQIRLMEVFAGFVEHTDTQAVRLLDTLDELGIRDNTLIFYIWSDNGASAEGQRGTISELLAQNLVETEIKDHIRVLDEMGGFDVIGSEKTDNMYHAAWAWATSSPLKATKLVAGFFGGTRTPMAVSWPKKIKPDQTPRPQFHHVNDIAPTVYELLGITPPKTEEEFFKVLDAIKADGNYIPLAMGTKDLWEAATMGYQNIGPNYWKGEEGRLALIKGEQKLTDEGWVKPYEVLARWKDYLGDGFEAQTYPDSQNLFTLGRAAIYPAGSWEIGGFNTQAQFKMGAFLPPVAKDGDPCYISDHTDIAVGMNAKTAHPEEAKKLLSWISSAEFAEIYANSLPGFFSLNATPVKMEDPLAQEFVSWRDKCKSTIRSTYQILSRGTPNLENETWVESANVINGTDTPQVAAEKLQKGLDSWYKPQ